MNAKTPLPLGAPAYTICVERLDYAGKTKSFEFDGYGVLRELLDDVEAECQKRNWFEESHRFGHLVPHPGDDLGKGGKS